MKQNVCAVMCTCIDNKSCHTDCVDLRGYKFSPQLAQNIRRVSKLGLEICLETLYWQKTQKPFQREKIVREKFRNGYKCQ